MEALDREARWAREEERVERRRPCAKLVAGLVALDSIVGMNH